MDISFTCSTLSSPRSTFINWTHRGNIISRTDTDDHRDINTITELGVNGVKTTSTFTIFNVTGFDSSVVECIAEYLADDLSTVVAMITSETVLGVLGKWNNLPPRSYWHNHFTKVVLRRLLKVSSVQSFYYEIAFKCPLYGGCVRCAEIGCISEASIISIVHYHSLVTRANFSWFQSKITDFCVRRKPRKFCPTKILLYTVLFSADIINRFNPIPLATGGFIYEIQPKAPLPISVSLMFFYNDLESDRNMSVLSAVSYSNFTINHVAYSETVPFDRFRVKMALVHKDLMGPFFVSNNTFSESVRACVCVWQNPDQLRNVSSIAEIPIMPLLWRQGVLN